jgi:hypothetical protein
MAAPTKNVALKVSVYPSRAKLYRSNCAAERLSTMISDVSLIRMTNSFIKGGITLRTACGTIA